MAIGFGKRQSQFKDLEKIMDKAFRLHPEQQRLLIETTISKMESVITLIGENETALSSLTPQEVAGKLNELEKKFHQRELESRALEGLSEISDEDACERLFFLVATLSSITNGLSSTIQKVAA